MVTTLRNPLFQTFLLVAFFALFLSEASAQENRTLSWTAPTTNTDGSCISGTGCSNDLAGYKVKISTVSGNFSSARVITVTGATNTSLALSSLSPALTAGNYFAVVSAYNTSNSESANSSPELPFTVASSGNSLTVSKTGSGTGTVTSNPSGISCGADCTENYAPGTSVTLSAIAASNSTFTGWAGGGCVGTGTCVVTVNQATTVTATFSLRTYTLTVTRTGTGLGTVTGNGIACGSDCTEAINQGTSITLTAAPATGSSFTGWSGACTGTGTCTVLMDQVKSVSASFTALPKTPDSPTGVQLVLLGNP